MAKTIYPSIKKFYSGTEKYLLLGNGMNQLSSVISWDDLLKSICKKVKVKTERKGKPYQLFFDQLSFDIDPKQPVETNIRKLKSIMGVEALKLNPHPLLIELVNKPYYTHFMTTNYDYCIEKAIDPLFCQNQLKSKKRPKYSLYRFNLIDAKKIWHIHGESDNGYTGKLSNFPEASILIGFEHYADYLEKIHHLLKHPKGKGLATLMESADENWVHLFFSRDIDLIGFGLDFTEAHLWFILNFRARLSRKGATIINTIRWIIPGFSETGQQDKIQILKSLGVEVVLVPAAINDYADFYGNFIGSL